MKRHGRVAFSWIIYAVCELILRFDDSIIHSMIHSVRCSFEEGPPPSRHYFRFNRRPHTPHSGLACHATSRFFVLDVITKSQVSYFTEA